MLLRPYTGTCKFRPVLDPNLRRGVFRGVCFCAPIRVREKFGGFHISAHRHAKNAPGFTFPHRDTPKNAPDFTFPNKDTPKTHPILAPNLRRGSFRGVCNTPLHGCTQKIVWFHISAHGYTKNAPDFTLSNKDTPKTHPVLHPNRRRGVFRGVCNTPLHGYMKNVAGFTPNPSARFFGGRMQYAPTRVHAKIVRFHISVSGHAQNPLGFIPKSLERDISGRMQ